MGMRILLVLACVAALTSCSQGEGVQGDDLEAQLEEQRSLRIRIEALESEVAQLAEDARAAGEVRDTVTQLEERVAGFEEKVAALESGLQDNAEEREAALAELRNSLEGLRSSVSNLDGALEKVQRDLADLISRVNLLEQRFEDHERHPPG